MQSIKIVISYLGIFVILGLLYQYHIKYDYEPKVDPVLQTYVDEWRLDMDSAGISYSRAWDELKSIEIVECSKIKAGLINSNGGDEHTLGMVIKPDRRIVIDSSLLTMHESILRMTIYHELGHYAFNLDHIDDHEHIMNTNPLHYSEYKEKWPEFKYNYINTILTQLNER